MQSAFRRYLRCIFTVEITRTHNFTTSEAPLRLQALHQRHRLRRRDKQRARCMASSATRRDAKRIATRLSAAPICSSVLRRSSEQHGTMPRGMHSAHTG